MAKLTLFNNALPFSSKVVVVEDDSGDFELTRISFSKSNFQNEIVWLENGQKLIDYLLCQNEFEKNGQENPVLIFLDLNMPGLNGKETLEKLRQNRDISNLRIVLLTNADEEYVKSIQLDQFTYMQKPLTFEKMFDYIANSKDFLFE